MQKSADPPHAFSKSQSPLAVCAEQSPATAGDQVSDEGCLPPIQAFTTIQFLIMVVVIYPYCTIYSPNVVYNGIIPAETIAQKK